MKFFVFVLLTLPVVAFGELNLHPLFSDHAVIQQGQTVPVWGTAEPGSSVTVSFKGKTAECESGSNGKWMAKLPPFRSDASPGSMIVKSGESVVTVNDLLVGEVWICAGQSNMAMSVSRTDDAETVKADIAARKLGNLRLFKTPVAGADERQETVKSNWTLVDERTASSFSAVGFFFGRALLRDKNIPIGLIQSANGGTNAYSWINSDTLENDPVAEVTRSYWKGAIANAPAALERWKVKKAEWAEKARAARKEKKKFTERAPREPMHANHVKRPSGHYNAMVAPLQPYAIAGAIWYQGEANSRPPFCNQYKDLMFSLVEDWRDDWSKASGGEERRDFPFYMVQLPNYAKGHEQGWPLVREQMLKFWREGKNTGTVISIDTGDAKDIHPKNKMPVGERLARFARANAYDEDIIFSGPVFKELKIEGDKAVVSFEHTGSGLKSSDGESLRFFELADASGKFISANAAIDGENVVVTSPTISEPAAVRYAWINNPENPNFFNAEGLPASPFRSDSFEIPLD